MIRIFRRAKEKPAIIHTNFRKLGMVVDKQQHKWADYLNGKTEKISKRSKLTWLLLFCFVFGGSSVFLIVRGLDNKTAKIQIERMSFPAYVISYDTTIDFVPLPVLTGNGYRNIQRFKQLMDSLQLTATGKIKYDSICKARPGFMDSISFVEQIYQQQLKSK